MEQKIIKKVCNFKMDIVFQVYEFIELLSDIGHRFSVLIKVDAFIPRKGKGSENMKTITCFRWVYIFQIVGFASYPILVISYDLPLFYSDICNSFH